MDPVSRPAEQAFGAAEEGDTLQSVLVRQLDEYFEHLAGSQPHPLYSLVIGAVERPLLIYAMKKCSGNQCEAAKLLGINRNTLRKKLETHGLLPGKHS